jgi:hypothetical protein
MWVKDRSYGLWCEQSSGEVPTALAQASPRATEAELTAPDIGAVLCWVVANEAPVRLNEERKQMEKGKGYGPDRAYQELRCDIVL